MSWHVSNVAVVSHEERLFVRIVSFCCDPILIFNPLQQIDISEEWLSLVIWSNWLN